MNLGSRELLAVTLAGALIVLIFFSINYVRRKNSLFTIFNLASVFYAVIYGIVPIYYLFNIETAPFRISAYYRTDAQYQIELMALFGYLLLICGYVVGIRFGEKRGERALKEGIPYRKYELWAFLSFVVGMLGVFIEVQLQGGIASTLNSIESVRSFADSSVKSGSSNPLVFFRMFKPFIILSFYLYYFLFRKSGSTRHKFLSSLTFMLAAYVTFIGGGRTHIIIFLATVIIGFFMSRKKIKRIKIVRPEKRFFMFIFITIVAFASLVLLDPVFAYLTYGREMDFTTGARIESIISQFSFPTNNMLFVSSSEHVYRYFQDLYVWVISILPSYLTSRVGISEPTPLYEYNTVLQNGSMLGGGLPSDLLTFGLYQLGVTGLVVIAILFGFIISRADKLLDHYKSDPIMAPITARVMIYLGMMVMYADLEGTFRGRYDVIFLLVFLSDYRKYQQPSIKENKVYIQIANTNENEQRFERRSII